MAHPYWSTAKKPIAGLRAQIGIEHEDTMFAVIKTGGKQYRVTADDKITVMTLQGQAGDKVSFDEVLSFFDGSVTEIGAPLVAGASVAGEIVEQDRGPKVIAFKKRRRKNSRRKRGHRQDLTVIRITDLLLNGKSHRPTASEAPVAAAPVAAAPEAPAA